MLKFLSIAILVSSLLGTGLVSLATAQDALPAAAEVLAPAPALTVDETVPEDFFTVIDQGKIQVKVLHLAPGQTAPVLRAQLFSLTGAGRAATVGSDGIAYFEAVEPGVYGLVVSGPNYFASVALCAVDQSKSDLLPQSFSLPVIPVQSDLEIRNLASYMPAGNVSSPEIDLPSFEAVPTRAKNFYRTELRPDGTLVGRVYGIAAPTREDVDRSGTRIAILKAGRVVKEASTDRRGRFEVEGLTPGVYSIVASGSQGYAAFAFEASAAPRVTARGGQSTTFQLVAMQGPGEQPLDALLIPPAALPPIGQQVNSELDSRALAGTSGGTPGTGPAAGGGAAGGGTTGGGGGGTGGGGAGGGGAGGLGGISSLAGLAALTAAAGSGSDNGIPTTTPTAPSDANCPTEDVMTAAFSQ